MSYFQIATFWFLVTREYRSCHEIQAFIRCTRHKVSDTCTEKKCGGGGNYERKVTDLWQILRQHSIQVDFPPLYRVRFSLLPEKRQLNT